MPSASLDVDEYRRRRALPRPRPSRPPRARVRVSSLRRVAATTESGASLDEAVVDGALAGRLTDDRFASLMRYCGRLKRLEVRDAPKSFEANCLQNRTRLDVSKLPRCTR